MWRAWAGVVAGTSRLAPTHASRPRSSAPILAAGASGDALVGPVAVDDGEAASHSGMDAHRNRRLAEGVRSWSKAEHLQRMVSSGAFSWCREVALAAMETGDADRFGAGPIARTADRQWMAYTAGALVVIWVAVLVVSVFAPDLVSGAQQDHLPIAAFGTWLWGAVGTAAVLWTMSRLRDDPTARPLWTGHAPLGAAVLSALAGVVAIVFGRAPDSP